VDRPRRLATQRARTCGLGRSSGSPWATSNHH